MKRRTVSNQSVRESIFPLQISNTMEQSLRDDGETG